jgi:DNA-binding NtrC family response regulator
MKEKILVVEDEKNLLRLYQTVLHAKGYDVVTAVDGREALQKIRSEPVVLVVLDLELPDGYGLDYLPQILDMRPGIKVVINTGHPICELDSHACRADAYLTKSSNFTELTNTIDELLQHRHAVPFPIRKAGRQKRKMTTV